MQMEMMKVAANIENINVNNKKDIVNNSKPKYDDTLIETQLKLVVICKR